MKRWCAAFGCLCVAATVVCLEGHASNVVSGFSRTIVVGTLVRLKADTTYERRQASPVAPARIVSTSPSITETLFALGLGEQVVGVSNYCRFPPEVNKLPKVGTFLRPNPELIARLTPTLVVVHAGPNDAAQQLAKLRIPFITVDRGTLPSVFSTIRAIGKAAGAPDRAAALVASIEARLDRIRASVSGRPPKKVLIIMGRRAGTLTDLIAVGPRSYLHDLVGMAGGVNVLANSGLEYPRISMESIIRLDPDVIIDAGDMGDTPDDRERRRVTTEGLWNAQTLVRAARTNHVHAVTSDIFVVPGPRVVEAAETMARWLHGVQAP
jgi:iron complex transport system substrate-binding protein